MTENVVWHEGDVTDSERARAVLDQGATVWLTGLSGSGKSTIAVDLERLLIRSGSAAVRLDADNLRHGLNSDLGFSPEDRAENVRRVGHVALFLAKAGIAAIVPIISPYQADRAAIREHHEAAGVRFVEVFVDTPLEVCEQRDPKGLYARARTGELSDMTGIDAPYEVPVQPDLVVETVSISSSDVAHRILELIKGTIS